MDTPILVAVISAAAGILASALTFYFTKKKEHESEWRKQKLENYKSLLSAMSSVVGKRPTVEARVQFAHAVNHIMLVASPPILVALRSLLDETSKAQKDKTDNQHDKLLTELMYTIRQDLGIKPNRASSDYQFRLWAPNSDTT